VSIGSSLPYLTSYSVHDGTVKGHSVQTPSITPMGHNILFLVSEQLTSI